MTARKHDVGMFEKLAIKWASSYVGRFLDGKKTYIAAAGGLAIGIYKITEGNVEEGLTDVWVAIAAMFLRKGVEKTAI